MKNLQIMLFGLRVRHKGSINKKKGLVEYSANWLKIEN